MKILVGTTITKDDSIQRLWLELQLRYLRATTDQFDHVAVVWGGTKEGFPETNIIVPEVSVEGCEAHLKGLANLLRFFKEQQDCYDYFLFLDSDAFPIKKQWLHILLNKMESRHVFEETGMALPCTVGRHFDIAIPVRSENLETRLHSSVLFAKKEALPHLNFSYGPVPQGDLCGDRETDIHLPEYETKRRHLAFPLMRSNQHNVHPLACGIYYNMFYHHCCGSGREFRVRGHKYWHEELPDTERFAKELFDNPSGFIKKLAGWTPRKYAQP